MKRDMPWSAQVQRLIEQAKPVRPLSQATRARVLRRAHSSVLEGASVDPSKVSSQRLAAPAATWLGGAALAVGLGVAGIAFHLHETKIPAADHANATASAAAVSSGFEPVPPSSSLAAPESTAPAASTTEMARVSRPAPVAESYAAELTLLRRAYTAYGNRDFAAALRLLAEHGSHFPNGRLAEEREALRVRALSGSGSSEAARLAAHAFAARFPHSVLLSRTIAAVDAGE